MKFNLIKTIDANILKRAFGSLNSNDVLFHIYISYIRLFAKHFHWTFVSCYTNMPQVELVGELVIENLTGFWCIGLLEWALYNIDWLVKEANIDTKLEDHCNISAKCWIEIAFALLFTHSLWVCRVGEYEGM